MRKKNKKRRERKKGEISPPSPALNVVSPLMSDDNPSEKGIKNMNLEKKRKTPGAGNMSRFAGDYCYCAA